MESPSFTDAHPSPTSLPGRDPLADADTTLIRKRQRLTPTQLGGEDWFSAGRSESPLQIDIIPPEQELAPTAAIYIMGDEDLTAGYIESFPGVTDQRRPEHLAASFANSCYDSKGPSLYRIDQFADWIQDHVSATSASQNYSSYVQDRVFWYHVGRCFEGLAKRRPGVLQRKTSSSQIFYHDFFCSFAKLFASLCTIEAEQLERATSRRDSAKPASPGKCSLLFYNYAIAFEMLMSRDESAPYDAFSKTQRAMVSTFSNNQENLASFFRTFSLIATRADEVEGSCLALYCYLKIASHCLSVVTLTGLADVGPAERDVSNFSDDEFHATRGTVVKILELALARALPAITKTNPDYLPSGFHAAFIDTLAHLAALLAPSYLPDGFERTLERTSNLSVKPDELLIPESGLALTNGLLPLKARVSVVYKLELFNVLVKSNIMTLRVIGLEHLNDLLLSLWKTYNIEFRAHNSHQMLQLASRYLLTYEVVKYLFGPDSHADLMRRSSRTVEFLLATHSLTKSDVDVLWNSCLYNQGSDIGQAGCSALLSILQEKATAIYLCRKYETLSSAQLGRTMLFLFEKIIEPMVTRMRTPTENLEVSRVCVHVFREISLAWDDNEVQGFRSMISHVIIQLLTSSGERAEFQRILLELCAEAVQGQTVYATSSIHLLLDLAIDLPHTATVSPFTNLISFHDIIAELCHFVNDHKAQGAEISTFRHALLSRIRLASLTLAFTRNACNAKIERTFWDHAYGADAIDNHARAIAWQSLLADTQVNPAFHEFFERCTALYLPHLDAAYAPPEIILAAHYGVDTALQNLKFDFPLRDQILRFALTSPSEVYGEHFLKAIVVILFSKAALDYPEAAEKQQIAITDRCLDCICAHRGNESIRAVALLRLLLSESIEFAKVAPSTKGFFSETQANDATRDTLSIPIRLYGNEGVQQLAITVGEQDTFAVVHSELARLTRSDDFLVICAGLPLDLAKAPATKIQNSKIAGQTLTVKKKITLQSIENDRSRRIGRTSLERSILLRFDDLYDQLDGSDTGNEKANTGNEKILSLLVSLQHTTTWRPISLDQSRWKILYWFHRLRDELHEQLSRGVADAMFIQMGVHVLINALEHFKTSTDWVLLRSIAVGLMDFIIERPVIDYAHEYFTDPDRFVNSAFCILECGARMVGQSDNASEIQEITQTTANIYRFVLEASRLDTVVCDALVHSPQVKPILIKLLLNSTLCGSIAKCMQNFCEDEETPTKAKALFWTIALDCMSQPPNDPGSCDHLFHLSRRILEANRDVVSSDTQLRSIIAQLSTTMLRTSDRELLGINSKNSLVSGLCFVLQGCVQKLKSSKNPLDLHGLALEITRKLLFARRTEPLDREVVSMPILTGETRRRLYYLVTTLCEDVTTLRSLSNLTLEALAMSDIPAYFQFPGPEGFNRTECGYSGLVNLQQTCYMNSLLQQLFMNINFRKFIFDTPIKDAHRQVVLQEFKCAFANMQDSYSLAYCPDNLAKALDVDVTIQDDAQIFFTVLLGKLEASMPDEQAVKSLKTFFGGLNKSQTVGECGHVSESPDEYYNLSLVVKDKSSLHESLQEYVQGATLEGGDKFKCMSCESKSGGVYVNASRRTGLENVPDNLVLGLKRFQYETYDGGAKVNDTFDFPEKIDMNPYKIQHLASPQQPMEPDIFQLVGVVVHDGTLQYGHYWSYAAERSLASDGTMPWYKLEDRMASRVTLREVLSQTRGGFMKTETNDQAWLRSDNAYVLFYERLSSIKATAIEQPSSLGLMTGLCPKVAIPADLHQAITADNETHIRQLNMFADEHADFVRSLLIKYEDISRDIRCKDQSMELLLVKLACEHLQSVTIRTQPLAYLENITESLENLIQAHPDNACAFLTFLFDQIDHETCERFVFHRRAVVRAGTRQLIVSSLRSLRVQDRFRYGLDSHGQIREDPRSHVHCVAVAHSKLSSRLHISAARCSWPEYFEFAAEIAAFGREEAQMIMDRGYLMLALEMLHVRCDTSLQLKYDQLWYNMQNNRVYPFYSLTDCVYALLKDHVDLLNISSGKGDLLLEEEIEMITRISKGGRNTLVIRALETLRDSEPQYLGPAKLVSLLTDQSKTDDQVVKTAVVALKCGLEGIRHTYYMDVISYCISHGNMAERYKESLIAAVARITDHYEDTAEILTDFMKDVYLREPAYVLKFAPEWADKLLACDDAETEGSTLLWLRRHMLTRWSLVVRFTQRDLTLDLAHAMATKGLTAKLMYTLQKAHSLQQEYEEFENAAEALRECATWLERFVKAAHEHLLPAETESEKQQNNKEILRGETQVDQQTVEDLKEAAADASGILEQCQEVFEWLGDWSEGKESNMLAYRQRYTRDVRAARSMDGHVVDLVSGSDGEDDEEDEDEEDEADDELI